MNTPAIQVSDLTYEYGETRALDNLSLTVPDGSLFGLLGPNGAGKTTLFKALATLLPVSNGSVSMFGRDVSRNEAEIRSRIAVVFQSAHVDPILTGRENLQFHGSMYGHSSSDVRERSQQLLDRFDLLDRADDRVSSYSGGMRRRLELAKGLLHRPDLLLLDEPSSGLDLAARKQLWADLKDLHDRENLTIVMATHDMDEAELCDRLAFMVDGRCLTNDRKETLKQSLGEEVLYLEVDEPETFERDFQSQFSKPVERMNGRILIEMNNSASFIPKVVERFPGRIQSVTLRQPTLGDVFFKTTGASLEEEV